MSATMPFNASEAVAARNATLDAILAAAGMSREQLPPFDAEGYSLRVRLPFGHNTHLWIWSDEDVFLKIEKCDAETAGMILKWLRWTSEPQKPEEDWSDHAKWVWGRRQTLDDVSAAMLLRADHRKFLRAIERMEKPTPWVFSLGQWRAPWREIRRWWKSLQSQKEKPDDAVDAG